MGGDMADLGAMLLKGLLWCFSPLVKLFAACVGVLLALVLSGDITPDGKMNINRGVIIRFLLSAVFSVFAGQWIIEMRGLHLSIAAQGTVMIVVGTFGFLIIGLFYQALQMMRGKSLSEITTEISAAFRAVFFKAK